MNLHTRLPRLATLALLLPALLSAADATWTGAGTDNKWTTDTNWLDSTGPTASLDAIIDLPNATTIDLDSQAVTARSLSLTATNATTITGGGSLTLATGNITKTGSNALTIYSDIILGSSGTWDIASSNILTMRSAISETSGNQGIRKTGAGTLYLMAASTFTGGVEMDGGNIYLQHNNALGNGTLTLTSGNMLIFNTGAIANTIAFNLADNSATDWRMGDASGFSHDITLSGPITGTGILRTRGPAGTWRFTESIQLTGHLNFAANDTVTTGAYSYILSANPALSSKSYITGNIRLGINDAAASFNLLFDQAGAYDGFNNIEIFATNSRNTIAGIHDTGLVTLAPAGGNGIVLNNSAAAADRPAATVNLATLNQGTTTRIDKRITENGASTPVTINAIWQQIDAAATAAAATPVYTSLSPKGTIEFAAPAGSTYAGGTTIEAGTLRVTNTTGSATGTGALLVKTGARLDGTGIIAPSGANGIRINAGATLAAGTADATGALRFDGSPTTAPLLTLDSGATLELRLGSPGNGDQIALWNFTTGDLVLSNNTINLIDAGGLAEGTYTLITLFADSGINSVVSSGITGGLTLGTGLEAFAASHLEYLGDRINLVVANAPSIPETATWLWITLPGLLGIALHQHHRYLNRETRSHLIMNNRPTAAFTLIELLTVITIIGVLAAISIPVSITVRNKAHGIRCLSNLRQLQAANALYAADHKDAYVPFRDDEHAAENGSRWWLTNPDYLTILSPQGRSLIDQLKCPLGKHLYNTPSTEKSTAYGFNITDVPNIAIPGGDGFRTQVSISQIQRPSQTIAMADGRDMIFTWYNSNNGTGDDYAASTISYRHNNASNIVYWDGHAALVKREKLAKDPADHNKPQWRILD
ncbi:MAG: prepilin-type N-terminal cleavage/methylation domain-containing protein [Opitutaceae bacterium]|jgi:prepilin-type N-terminal cleavage/methylation domain-containing protein/prepilin-type processing-associated H-X9-DG protein|nr:prepilin-type N-terminal cleavage/methylation domain-containing protein [Opitutaceae bacterium]